MSKLFVLGSTYEKLQGDMETMRWSLEKQLEQMNAERAALIARINAGEDYRDELERRIEAYRIDNGTLYANLEKERHKCQTAEKTIKELRLQLMSWEANWAARSEKGEDHAPAGQEAVPGRAGGEAECLCAS